MPTNEIELENDTSKPPSKKRRIYSKEEGKKNSPDNTPLKKVLLLATAQLASTPSTSAIMFAAYNCTLPVFHGAANISLFDSCDRPPITNQFSNVQYEL